MQQEKQDNHLNWVVIVSFPASLGAGAAPSDFSWGVSDCDCGCCCCCFACCVCFRASAFSEILFSSSPANLQKNKETLTQLIAYANHNDCGGAHEKFRNRIIIIFRVGISLFVSKWLICWLFNVLSSFLYYYAIEKKN